MGVLRLWFTFEETVDRSTYLRHGAGLALLKYAGDAALMAAAGLVWTPLDYVGSTPLLLTDRLTEAPALIAPAVAVWTIPFLWIGISMTIRRLLDAGYSAWWSMLFFVPVINYLLLAWMALAGSNPMRGRPGEEAGPSGERLPSALLSMAIGTVVGLALLGLAVFQFGTYGLSLFMGTPFALGVVTAYTFSRQYPATTKEAIEVVSMTMVLVAGFAFVLGFEGAVCLVMVAPLGLGIAALGALVGRRLAMAGESAARGATLLVVLLPAGMISESGDSGATLREVRSSIVIEGTTADVWEHVVEFPPLVPPSGLIFKLGVAYPTHARIEGEGVGAIRYCEFSTGAFVEPITVWEPGKRLAFDVTESPAPLRELTPFTVDPPHLRDYLMPRAGEFRITDLGEGRVLLEGSTWYEQRLRPEGYWVLWSDLIVSRIHDSVLEHIREQVEGGGSVAAGH